MKPVESTNLAFCENGAGYGGAVISLAELLKHITPDFTPHIYTSIGSPDYQRLAELGHWRHLKATETINRKWLRTSGIPLASMVDNLFNVLPNAFRYYMAFREDEIDAVYLNNDASCNLAPAIAGKLSGLPLIMHARGFTADTRSNRWVLSCLEHCIAVSHAVKNNLLSLGLPPEKCSVVPEGLDLKRFHPRPPKSELRNELGLTELQPVITLVGGLIDWKGQDVVLDAAPAILKKFPQAIFLLVGSAYGIDDAFSKVIHQRAKLPELSGSIRLLGSRGDIPDILSISSVVLHASTKPEPFGRTFLEGMAMGKPVIASNEGGPLDVIESGSDGILITAGRPDLLAQAVIHLLENPELRNRLGTNGARKAENYSIESHTRAVLDALEPVTRHRRHQSSKIQEHH